MRGHTSITESFSETVEDDIKPCHQESNSKCTESNLCSIDDKKFEAFPEENDTDYKDSNDLICNEHLQLHIRDHDGEENSNTKNLVHVKEQTTENGKKSNSTTNSSSECKSPKIELAGYTLNELYRDYVKIKVDLYGNPVYSCKLCPTINFTQKIPITEHMLYHQNQMQKELSCGICRDKFSTHHKLSVHSKPQTDDNMYLRCSLKYLKMHMDDNLNSQTYPCTDCGKVFKEKLNLTNHFLNGHLLKPTYKCKICCFSSKCYQGLQAHNKKGHNRKNIYKCLICKDVFEEKKELSIHFRNHHVNHTYECMECGNAFMRKANLTIHLRVHTEEKPYECLECGKGFKYKRNLKKHQTTIHSSKSK